MNPIVIINSPTFEGDYATNVSPVVLKGRVVIKTGETLVA